MDTQDAPEEIKRALAKAAKTDSAQDKGSNAQARAIAQQWFPTLCDGIGCALTRTSDKATRGFVSLATKLGREKLTLCILLGAIDGAAHENTLAETARGIGANIYLECAAAGHLQNLPTSFAPARYKERFRSSQKARRVLMRDLYRAKSWDSGEQLRAGNWGIDCVLEFLSEAFTVEKRLPEKKHSKVPQTEKYLLLKPEACAAAAYSVQELIKRHPVWMPKPVPPAKWEDWEKGGTSDPMLAGTLTIVSRRSARIEKVVRAAIQDGSMKLTLDALNSLQAVPWSINKPVLQALQECDADGIKVPGLPGKNDKGDYALFLADIQTAEELMNQRFWTAMHMDWRGRIYSVPHFNFQRDDRVRALFQFADGEPIGAEGLYWLKVHVANCGGKISETPLDISKTPFDERAKWTEENIDRIQKCADGPLHDHWWTKADSPFLFLAACFELTSALKEGPTFVSRLPISFDGSCNGYQHLSAMTRDEETAKRVNLVPSDAPQDIYGEIAASVLARVKKEVRLSNARGAFARAWIKCGIDRSLVKPPVMIHVYGGTHVGMAREVGKGLDEASLPEVSFDKACFYLVEHIRCCLEKAVTRPVEAMSFLRDLAKSANSANTSLRWITPTGFPWQNAYYVPKTEQIRLTLHSLSLKFQIKNATGEDTPEVNKDGARNGAVPNFVHACDAAHLMCTVNAAVAKGITSIATVHDSFGCLPSRAERFRKIILEEFVRMYSEHDVLAEIRDLGVLQAKKLPPLPQKGTFELDEVLKADFAFA